MILAGCGSIPIKYKQETMEIRENVYKLAKEFSPHTLNLAEFEMQKASDEMEKKHYANARHHYEEARKYYFQAKIESLELQKVYLKVVYDVLLDTEFVMEEIYSLTGQKINDCFKEAVLEARENLSKKKFSEKEFLQVINSLFDYFLKFGKETYTDDFSKLNSLIEKSNKMMEENLSHIENEKVEKAKVAAYLPFNSIEEAKNIAIKINEKGCKDLKEIVEETTKKKNR